MAPVARRPFSTADALIVVSTDGYFDVFPSGVSTPRRRPVYRGAIAELGPLVSGPDGRMLVRPDSATLRAAVTAWSGKSGAAAAAGLLGPGRAGGPA